MSYKDSICSKGVSCSDCEESCTYDDKLVRQLVEQVTVHEKRLVVRFKSGIEGEVELQIRIKTCPIHEQKWFVDKAAFL